MAEQAQHADHKHQKQVQPAKSVQQDPAVQAESADLLALQRAVLNPAQAAPGDILGLQRTAGNRAVSRLIQAKLTVGGAGDRYEQEADRVAERILTMPAPSTSVPEAERSGRGQPSAVSRQPGLQRQEDEEEVQTKPLAAGIIPLVQRQEDEEEIQTKPLAAGTTTLVQRQEDEEEVQTKPLVQRRPDGSFDAAPEMESRLAAGRGNGQPLSGDVRGFMEDRFGADFGGVQVHTDPEAAGLSHQIHAQAFTHGSDIYLGTGRYEPGTDAGKRLLAHELTHVVQQGKATAQRKTAGTIARRPAEAIQRIGNPFKTVGSAISGAGKTVGEGIHDYSIAGAYTAGQNISSAAKTVGHGISSAAKTVGHGISSAAKTAGGAISSAAKEVRDTTIAGAYTAKQHVVDPLTAKVHGAYVGTRDIVDPMEAPKEIATADDANDYAGKLMYRVDGHYMETQRNSRFIAEDVFALDHALQVGTKKLEKKKLQLSTVQEPTGRFARLKKSAADQRIQLEADIAGITTNLNELQDEKSKAYGRLTQAETYESDLQDDSDSVRNTYLTQVLPWKKNNKSITATEKAVLQQFATTESADAAKRNDVSHMVNNVREAGRGERLLLNLTKIIGAKVVNFGLQTATLGVVGMDAKDRPGGYSSTIKLNTMMGKLRAEAKRLYAIGTSTLYKNTGLSKAYAALKGVSTLVIVPLRTVTASVGMLSTIVGALIGLLSVGFAAPVSAVCVQISAICTYIALGLTALNAIINGALATVNALRLQFAANRTKAAGLRAEYSETLQTSIMDVITSAATAGGLTASAGVVEAAHIEGYGFKDVLSGAYSSNVPMGVTVLKVGTKLAAGTAPDLASQALTPVVFDKASPNTKLLVESTRKDLMKQEHRHPSLVSTMVPSPFSTEHRKIKGYVLGVPAPKFVTQVAPQAIKGTGKAIQGAGTSIADFTKEEYEAARKKIGDSGLAKSFNKNIVPLTKKVFGVQNKIDWVSEKFRDLKKHFEKRSTKIGPAEHEDAKELTNIGSNMGDTSKKLMGGLPDALTEGQAEVAELAKHQ